MTKRVSMETSEVLALAEQLINEAEVEGLVLRTMGALAMLMRVRNSPICLQLYTQIGRIEEGSLQLTDIDFVGYKKQRTKIESFLRSRGFEPDYYVNAMFGEQRMIFHHPNRLFSIDIFLSPLKFSHMVDLGTQPGRGRIELIKYTLAPADLLLLKLQIHDINRKDLADATILLSCHEVSEGSEEGINMQRVIEVLCDDWGFYYDAMSNLGKVKLFVQELDAKLPQFHELLERAINNVNLIEEAVEKAPKTKNWLRRSKIGTRKRWYETVEEI